MATVAALAAVAVVVALGNLVCALAVDAADGPWVGAARVATGAIAVQVLSQLVGVVLGLVLPWAWLAVVADVVVPLGLWAATGALGWFAVQSWATPYGVVVDLLAGTSDDLVWVRAATVALLWVNLPCLVLRRSRVRGALSSSPGPAHAGRYP